MVEVLPPELWGQILTFVVSRPVFQCTTRLVCRMWYKLMDTTWMEKIIRKHNIKLIKTIHPEKNTDRISFYLSLHTFFQALMHMQMERPPSHRKCGCSPDYQDLYCVYCNERHTWMCMSHGTRPLKDSVCTSCVVYSDDLLFLFREDFALYEKFKWNA